MSVHDVLKRTGPRKLLALDGGGIRGVLTIEILAAVEDRLGGALRRGPEFVLADYFDYIAGTSTGAIVATCLSWGMSVDQVRRFYHDNAREMFEKSSVFRRFRYRYEDDNLSSKLREVFGETTTLGTDRLRTLLMLVMRNASTDSPWPVSNNPKAKYNLRVREDGCPRDDCNLDLSLWQLIRASTAAPVYFPPEVVRVGSKEFVFVDGGITTYNNPAFQLFLMATVEPYNLGWPAGEDRKLLVSIVTGTTPDANADLQPSEMNLLYNASSIPSALMTAALHEQDFLCRVFGRCLYGDPIDREVGDCIDTKSPISPKLFTYVRYNAELSRSGLDALGLRDVEPEHVQKLDSIDYVEELQAVGQKVGEKVKPDHFAGFLY